jgi:hypothetical protein
MMLAAFVVGIILPVPDVMVFLTVVFNGIAIGFVGVRISLVLDAMAFRLVLSRLMHVVYATETIQLVRVVMV